LLLLQNPAPSCCFSNRTSTMTRGYGRKVKVRYVDTDLVITKRK